MSVLNHLRGLRHQMLASGVRPTRATLTKADLAKLNAEIDGLGYRGEERASVVFGMKIEQGKKTEVLR